MTSGTYSAWLMLEARRVGRSLQMTECASRRQHSGGGRNAFVTARRSTAIASSLVCASASPWKTLQGSKRFAAIFPFDRFSKPKMIAWFAPSAPRKERAMGVPQRLQKLLEVPVSSAIRTSPQTHRPVTCEWLAGFLDALAARFGELASGVILDAPV